MDANVDNEDGEEDEVGNIDISTQMQYGDTDDGIWPGEFVVMTIVVTEPEAEPERRWSGRDYAGGGWSVILVLRSLSFFGTTA